VTEQAVKQALVPLSVRKAQGPDMLSFGAGRLLCKWEKQNIIELTKGSCPNIPAPRRVEAGKLGRNPQAGKDDYTKLNAYHFIFLLSRLGNVVEIVVAEQLGGESERRGLLSDGQYGNRNRRSVINAAAMMVIRVHAAWRVGSRTGVLLVDIKAAFPSVGRGSLIHTMRGKGMDGDLIRWMASFLSDGTVAIIIEGNVTERHPVDAGILQCSPMSPIIFAI
jgi:hypothetical protein